MCESVFYVSALCLNIVFQLLGWSMVLSASSSALAGEVEQSANKVETTRELEQKSSNLDRFFVTAVVVADIPFISIVQYRDICNFFYGPEGW